MNKRFLLMCGWIFLALMVAVLIISPVYAGVQSELQLQTIPTTSSGSTGPMVTVAAGQSETFIKVRSGPHVLFSQIGILSVGQQAKALGVTAGGDWIMIEYPGVQGGVGWVYSGFVSLSPGDLPIVEPVSSPTPMMTQTIDPTLAAQFIVSVEPTRMATFTPAEPISIPTYSIDNGTAIVGIPIGLIIILLAVLGIIIGVISILANR